MDDSIEKDRGMIGIGPDDTLSLDLTIVFLMEKKILRKYFYLYL